MRSSVPYLSREVGRQGTTANCKVPFQIIQNAACSHRGQIASVEPPDATVKGAAGRGQAVLLAPHGRVPEVAQRLMCEHTVLRNYLRGRSLAQRTRHGIRSQTLMKSKHFKDSMASGGLDRPHHQCLARVRRRPERLSRGGLSTGHSAPSGGTWPASACTSPVVNSSVSRI
ncbi:hypothetical protein J3F83DRAFT_755480 [Trichoderma novae-zelandiae]